MLSFGEASDILRAASEYMADAILRNMEQGVEDPKEYGRRMDYISASALRDFLLDRGLRPRVISEEWFDDYEPGEDWILVVDPIDGTSNLSRGIPFSAVSLAIAESDSMEGVYAGMVRNIFTGETYIAYRGRGAYKDGREIRVSKTLKTIDAFISISIIHQYPGVSPTLELLRYTNYPRHFGSAALEDCMVAEGRLDAHVDVRGSLRVFDIAASQLIVREAGGHVWITQDDSRDVRLSRIYGIKIVSASTPHLLERLLDLLSL